MNNEEFQRKAKLYIELSRQFEATKEEIKRLRDELLPYVPEGKPITIEMKALKHMKVVRPYFDEGRFKQDYPALHKKYSRPVPQDYLKIVEASLKKSKRREINKFQIDDEE